MAEGEGGGGGAAYVYVCVDGVYACAYTRMHVLHRKYQCSYNIIGTYTQHANSHRTLSGSLTGWTETTGVYTILLHTQITRCTSYSQRRGHAQRLAVLGTRRYRAFGSRRGALLPLLAVLAH